MINVFNEKKKNWNKKILYKLHNIYGNNINWVINA